MMAFHEVVCITYALVKEVASSRRVSQLMGMACNKLVLTD